MPSISFFYGIIIAMYYDDHNPPHFHAIYQDKRAEMTFDGEIIKGDLPKKQLRLVQAWATIHEEDLKTNWELLKNAAQPEKIEPLH